MKRFKKILCGVMLTSFVILGSVSVFANGFGSNAGSGDSGGGKVNTSDKGGDKAECNHNQNLLMVKQTKMAKLTSYIKLLLPTMKIE